MAYAVVICSVVKPIARRMLISLLWFEMRIVMFETTEKVVMSVAMTVITRKR